MPKINNKELFAPNGKKSNLSPELWHLVRSKTFLNWFGDWLSLEQAKVNDSGIDDITLEYLSKNVSKVVDENGEPLLCYHGTKNKDFNVFDETLTGDNSGNDGHFGYGFYFSNDIIEAKTYTYRDNPIIKQVFLNLKNPFMGADMNYLSLYAQEMGYYKVNVGIDKNWLTSKLMEYNHVAYYLFNSILQFGQEKGWEKFINKYGYIESDIDLNDVADWTNYLDPNADTELPDWLDEQLKKIFKEEPKYLQNYPYNNTPRLLYYMDYGNNARWLTEKFKKDGFDGVIIGSEYIAFKPNQIKLADTTNITFDMNNNDIRFEEGGKLNIGDNTNIGIIEDEYKNQFKINGNWYAKSLVFTVNLSTQDKQQQEFDSIVAKLKKERESGLKKLYHGTDNKSYEKIINSHKIGVGKGVTFFTDKRSEAVDYARNKSKYRNVEGNGKVLVVNVPSWAVQKNTATGEYETEFELEQINDIYMPTKESVLNEYSTKFDGGGSITSNNPTEPANLMTLQEYQEKVSPLIKEYNKFVKKNEKYLIKASFYGLFYYTLEEILNDFKNDNVKGDRFKKYKYETNLSDDEFIKNKFKYEQKSLENTPEEVVAKNKEYFDKLSKYFTEEEIVKFIDKDELNSNKRSIRRAIDNGSYKEMLEKGIITVEQIQMVSDSVGVKLPKKTFDDKTIKNNENKALYDALYNSMPKVNVEVLSKMVDEIKETFKPLEKIIYEKERQRYNKIILEIAEKKETEFTSLQSKVPFYNKVFSFQTEKRNKLQESWAMNIFLLPNWEENLKQEIFAFIEELQNNMLISIISNFSKITLPIKNISQLKLIVGSKGFEGKYLFNFENGSSFIFKTEAIGAGGYNVQRYHFRYLSNFTDIHLTDGTKVSDRISILEHFAIPIEEVDPFLLLENANSPEEIINVVYECLISKGTKFYNPKYVKKGGNETTSLIGVYFNPNQYGYSKYKALTLMKDRPIEENKTKAKEFLTEISAKKYKPESTQFDILKKENGGSINQLFELILYLVDLSTDEQNTTAYYGIDENDAKEAFDSASYDDFYNEKGGVAILSKQLNTYEFIGELGEDETIEDYPIEEYYEDKDVYKLIDEGLYEEINNRDVEPPPTEQEIERDAAQELEADVIAYCKKICEDYKTAAYMGSTFYGLKSYKDGYIMIRVGDHYFNPANVALGKNVIWQDNKSININLENVTKNIYGFLSIVIRDSNKLNYHQSDFLTEIKQRQEDAKYDLVRYIVYKPEDYVSYDEYSSPDFEIDIDDDIDIIEGEIDRAMEDKAFDEDEDGYSLKLFKDGGNVEEKINENNYFLNTKCGWQIINVGDKAWDKFSELKNKQNVIFKKSPNSFGLYSQYVIDGDVVYRISDHWGHVGTCTWTLLNNQIPNWLWNRKPYVLAKANFSDFEFKKSKVEFKDGGQLTTEHKELYKEWKSLVNMSKSELEKFYNSLEGKVAGLTFKEAKELGIHSGRESARWIMKMKEIPVSKWNNDHFVWAKRQVNFIKRMSGVNGKLYDEKGNKTRKHLALLIWGHNPEKKEQGGSVEEVLLAPNGKPSKLTKEQYNLVRTPAFKSWFGDWENDPENSSKVVDQETKEPLVVYHGFMYNYGNSKKFYEFKNLPAFFSKSRSFAEQYASTKSMDMALDADIDSYACFLNIRKLFDPENKSNIELARKELPEKIKVSHGTMWFLDADIPKEEVIEQMQGIVTITPDHMANDILNANAGDILHEKISMSQTEPQILIYKDEDWAYTANRRSFDEAVAYEVADFILTDTHPTKIKYKGRYLPTLILNEETYRYSENTDPDYLEYKQKVEERKQYYIDNLFTASYQDKDDDYRYIKAKNSRGFERIIYVKKRNLKSYKTKTDNNWTMFENEQVQKFLTDNKFGGWISFERKDKTYAVFDANNIKLADGTNTTFSSDSKDIRFDKGGIVLNEDTKDSILKANNDDYVYLYHASPVKLDYIKPSDKSNFRFSEKGFVYLATNPNNAKGYVTLKGGNPYLYKVKVKKSELLPDSGFIKVHGGKNTLHDSVNLYGLARVKRPIYGNEIELIESPEFKMGGKTIAQTPAPKKDVIYGSSENKPNSASNSDAAQKIVFDDKTIKSIQNIINKHNEENPSKKIPISTAKAVVRRGTGAYSSSHRPTITDGKPNSRVAWGLARLNAFIYKIQKGHSKSGNYTQDDDLIKELGLEVKKYEDGGNTSLEDIPNMYIHKREELINEAKSLYKDVQGVYRNVFLEKTEQVLFEIAIQANSSESEKRGAINTFGEKLVKIALNLFPNAKVGDDFNTKKQQMNKKFDAGGTIVTSEGTTNDGSKGGIFVGKRHSEGGIKVKVEGSHQVEVEDGEPIIIPEAVNDTELKSFDGEMKTNKQILSDINTEAGGVEIKEQGGEIKVKPNSVIITRTAILDDTKHEFEGEMLTNKEILSRINQSGGGLAFEAGGEVPENIMVTGKQYKYGGKMMSDSDIVTSCGCGCTMANGGKLRISSLNSEIEKLYAEKQLELGVDIERQEHEATLDNLKIGIISTDEALEEIAQTHLNEDKNYYEDGGEIFIDISNEIQENDDEIIESQFGTTNLK